MSGPSPISPVRAVLCAALLFIAACAGGTGTDVESEGETSGADNGGNVGDDTVLSDDAGTSSDDATPDDAATGDDATIGDDAGTDESDGAGGDTGGDAGGGDAATDTGPIDCPGGEGCGCSDNNECDNGICIDTPGGKKCALKCTDSCPNGYTCSKYGDGDSTFVCTPDHLALCSPCGQDGDCKFQGPKSLCLDYGDTGKFCGSLCKADDDCPDAKYACVEVKEDTGALVKQCKLKDAAAACTCTTWAAASGAKTECKTTNDLGSCTGTRGCTDKGLSDCTAATPEAESCDNADNDCDGVTDNLDKAQTCSNKTWFDAGSKKACATDADCTAEGESCATDTNTCRTLIGECFGTPVCAPGGKLVCKDVATPKAEMCNGDDDNCDGKVDEGYVWKAPTDGSEVAVGGKCGLGVCAGGLVKCETLSSAICDTEKAAKADKDTCNGQDDDCDGEVDEQSCDDGTACTTDKCTPASGDCSHDPAADCDDKNTCTTDACDPKSGACTNTLLTGSCDDGNACSEGDACGEADGKAVCMPGTTTKTCDDSNVCTDDSCDGATGCVNLANAVTVVCYTATDANTQGVGECKAGVQACADGKLDAKCVGEVLPSLKESCDGKDDSCDGKTDEGCKTAGVEVSFAAASATVGSNTQSLTVELSGSSPAGESKNDKKTVHFGFLQWMSALLGK